MSAVELAAAVDTPSAVSYVNRICAHFAHKLAVERDGATGSVTFADGRCHLAADETGLQLRVTANDATKAASVAAIVDRHFVRFASREGLTLSWSESA